MGPPGRRPAGRRRRWARRCRVVPGRVGRGVRRTAPRRGRGASPLGSGVGRRRGRRLGRLLARRGRDSRLGGGLRRRGGLRPRGRPRCRLGLRLGGWRGRRAAALVGEQHRPHLLAAGALVGADPDHVPALAQDVGPMAGRIHEHAVDLGGRHVVRVVVPADVLARHLVAVADGIELVEDLADTRDVVAEIVVLDHVLAPPAGDGAERRIDLQGLETGTRPASVGESRPGSPRTTSCRRPRPTRTSDAGRGQGEGRPGTDEQGHRDGHPSGRETEGRKEDAAPGDAGETTCAPRTPWLTDRGSGVAVKVGSGGLGVRGAMVPVPEFAGTGGSGPVWWGRVPMGGARCGRDRRRWPRHGLTDVRDRCHPFVGRLRGRDQAGSLPNMPQRTLGQRDPRFATRIRPGLAHPEPDPRSHDRVPRVTGRSDLTTNRRANIWPRAARMTRRLATVLVDLRARRKIESPGDQRRPYRVKRPDHPGADTAEVAWMPI